MWVLWARKNVHFRVFRLHSGCGPGTPRPGKKPGPGRRDPKKCILRTSPRARSRHAAIRQKAGPEPPRPEKVHFADLTPSAVRQGAAKNHVGPRRVSRGPRPGRGPLAAWVGRAPCSLGALGGLGAPSSTASSGPRPGRGPLETRRCPTCFLVAPWRRLSLLRTCSCAPVHFSKPREANAYPFVCAYEKQGSRVCL